MASTAARRLGTVLLMVAAIVFVLLNGEWRSKSPQRTARESAARRAGRSSLDSLPGRAALRAEPARRAGPVAGRHHRHRDDGNGDLGSARAPEHLQGCVLLPRRRAASPAAGRHSQPAQRVDVAVSARDRAHRRVHRPVADLRPHHCRAFLRRRHHGRYPLIVPAARQADRHRRATHQSRRHPGARARGAS
jgi:hypothetical protein